MYRSRYENNQVIKESQDFDAETQVVRYGTFANIKSSEVVYDDDFYHQITVTDRLDTLAYQYYNNGSFLWLICIANDLTSPFDKSLVPGKVLRIPKSIERVMNVLKMKSSAHK